MNPALYPYMLSPHYSVLMSAFPSPFGIRYSIFSFSAFRIPHSALNSLCTIVPYPVTRNQTPEVREQKAEGRRQKAEGRRQIFRLQIVLLNAPCPMRYALCPYYPYPATRIPQLTTRNQIEY
jgi:hypothetical protein